MPLDHYPALGSAPDPAPAWSFATAASLAVSGGTLARPPAGRTEEALHQGLKFVLVLEGALDCALPGRPQARIGGPTLCVIADEGGHTASQAFDAAHPLRYVMVTIDAAAAGPLLGTEAGEVAWRHGDGPRLLCRPAPRVLAGLARQMLACPRHRPGARLYITGKGLELAGLATDLLMAAPGRTAPTPLPAAEVERLHAARDLLLASLADPPDLAHLARAVGLNMRKLAQGFRAHFGTTPATFVQRQRMEAAYHLIASGGATVAQAAWQVGYSPAAFATAFRRHFGVAPSSLRP
ncbi:MAG: AraC family transcriptional regulator [Azospirillaceae bacterium]|nr:AraC family transcriptional regulator [Azospirillaceae bacterium]